MKKLFLLCVVLIAGCASDENYTGPRASEAGWHRGFRPTYQPAASPKNLDWEDRR